MARWTVVRDQSILNASITFAHNLSATPLSVYAFVQAKDVAGTVPIAVVSLQTNSVTLRGGIATTVAVDIICIVPHSLIR